MVALTNYQVAGFIGAAGGVLIVCCVFAVCAILDALQQRRLERSYRRDTRLKVHEARFAIRDIRKRAIREMLKAEREYRDTVGYGEVIDGTCHEVEVRR
jgi:hypothetical protein